MIPTCKMSALVRRARAGCRFSFACLWNSHVARVRTVVSRSLRGSAIDDVVQEVALGALAGIRALRADDEATFVAWLQTIARNRTRTALAVAGRDRTLVDGDGPAVDELASLAGDPADSLQRREVWAALRRLPRCYRRPLRLHFLRGHTGPEIAARLGLSIGSVRVSLCRGLRRLRGCQEFRAAAM